MSTKDVALPSKIDPRMRHILNTITDGRPDWAALASRTGVNAEKWRNFNRHSTKPTTEMIEAIAEHYPQYAFWLVTGISDPKHGHVAPGNEGFPSAAPEQPNSTRYFQELITEKKLAIWVVHKWSEADLTFRDLASITDETLRGHIQLAHLGGNEFSTDLTELDTQHSKTLSAAKLRYAEIAMYKDMPDPDFDETVHAFNALERVLGDLTQGEGEMLDETKTVQEKLNKLRARIEQHKNHPKTLARFEKMRTPKDNQK